MQTSPTILEQTYDRLRGLGDRYNFIVDVERSLLNLFRNGEEVSARIGEALKTKFRNL